MPLHFLYFKADLVEGMFNVAICKEIPVTGIIFLLGNDIAEGKVLPVVQVADSTMCSGSPYMTF